MKRTQQETIKTNARDSKLNPQQKKIKRDIEVAIPSFHLPTEMYHQIFSYSAQNSYKPLLAYRCVNKDWNEWTDYFLHQLVNFGETLDHFAMLHREPSILRFKDDRQVDPKTKEFYENRLMNFSSQITLWGKGKEGFIFRTHERGFILIIANKPQCLPKFTPIDQFLLFKVFEDYFFSKKFLFDALSHEMEPTIDAVFDFLTSIKSSSTSSELLTRLIQHIHNSSINHSDTQISCVSLMNRFIEKKLVNLDLIKSYILHVSCLLCPEKWQLSEGVMALLVNCIMSFNEEMVTFLNENNESKNTIIIALIKLLSHSQRETSDFALELLTLFGNSDCLQAGQNIIIINHLDDQNWAVNIWLLVLLGPDALRTNELRAKISFQLVNNLNEGLLSLSSENEDINDGLYLEALTRDHIEGLMSVFEILVRDRYFDDNVQEESSRVIELLNDILERLGFNPEDYEGMDDSEDNEQ